MFSNNKFAPNCIWVQCQAKQICFCSVYDIECALNQLNNTVLMPKNVCATYSHFPVNWTRTIQTILIHSVSWHHDFYCVTWNEFCIKPHKQWKFFLCFVGSSCVLKILWTGHKMFRYTLIILTDSTSSSAVFLNCTGIQMLRPSLSWTVFCVRTAIRQTSSQVCTFVTSKFKRTIVMIMMSCSSQLVPKFT